MSHGILSNCSCAYSEKYCKKASCCNAKRSAGRSNRSAKRLLLRLALHCQYRMFRGRVEDLVFLVYSFLIVKTRLTPSSLSGGFCSLGAGINEKGTHFCRADMFCSFGRTKISRTNHAVINETTWAHGAFGKMAKTDRFR